MRGGLTDLASGFRSEMAAAPVDFRQVVKDLDPTQEILAEVLMEWADLRVAWRQALPATGGVPRIGPALRLTVPGAAGTGKTHTAQIAINQARKKFGSYDSVLTMAFSGVAAANLGSGARTIDSIFHTNRDSASDDLAGDQLDNLVDLLEHVELLVVDEVSTCGAASLEVESRRMQQVGRVFWRRRFRSPPPDDMGPFGGALACF